MQHLDEGMIHALLDGELPPAERDAAEAHVATCDACQAAVAEARGFVAAASRILTALDAVPGGVLPASSKSSVGGGARPPARFRLSRAWMAAAAMLVLSTATIIAIRPRGETPAMRVADASTEAEATAIVPTATAPMRSPAAPAEDRPALAGRAADKASTHELAERKDLRKKNGDSATLTVATAEPSEANDAMMAKAAPLPTDRAAGAAGAAATPVAAQAPIPAPPPADSVAKRMRSLRPSEVIVTGEGLSSTSGKLDAQPAPDTTAPRIVSRRTASARGDTTVTTVYDVRGAQITLIDRSTTRTEYARATSSGNATMPINSITWSDSTGRTRTLRGPVSQAELERIKTALFGAKP